MYFDVDIGIETAERSKKALKCYIQHLGHRFVEILTSRIQTHIYR